MGALLFSRRAGCCDTVFPGELVQGHSFLPGSSGRLSVAAAFMMGTLVCSELSCI